MPLLGATSGYTSPRSEEHLRTILARLKQDDDSTATDVTTLEASVLILEAIIGYELATFTSTTVIGQPLYISGSDTVVLADASVEGTSDVIGVAFEDVTAAGSGRYITHGIVTQSVWTSVTGSITLTAGANYYLSETTGLLTVTPPSTVGAYVIQVGTAVDLETLSVNLHHRLKL